MVENLQQPNTQPNQEIQTESTLFAEPIAHIGNFTITNSLLTSWIAVIILVIFFVSIKRKVKNPPAGGPRGLQNIFEIIMEQALSLADSVTGDRKKTEKFLPVTLALFLFILVNNWLGLLPGFGTIGFVERTGGHLAFIPLLRGGSADLNFTLALAIFSVVLANLMGIIMVGTWEHFNKFINMKAFITIPRQVREDISVVLVNPIKAFVGIIEIIGEIAKVASLSFRLFGNVFAGEVLLASMAALFAYFLPLPFIGLEIIVGLIQALIFSVLTLVYMTIATQAHEEH
jgi:F-type H+-transporting ATPase subunit a